MKSFVTKAKKTYPIILIIECKWKCSLRSVYLLFDIIELQIKKFSWSNCKWKIIKVKWELSHANKNYPMQMKIIQCKWKLSHANENYPIQMKKYPMQIKIIQCKWKIIACKWKIIQCKWIRSNIATFNMPYAGGDVFADRTQMPLRTWPS